jgi:hypothetical protein
MQVSQCWEPQEANTHAEIINLLHPFAETTIVGSLRPLLCPRKVTPSSPITMTLIDPAVDPLGAGSYLIDNAVCK